MLTQASSVDEERLLPNDRTDSTCGSNGTSARWGYPTMTSHGTRSHAQLENQDTDGGSRTDAGRRCLPGAGRGHGRQSICAGVVGPTQWHAQPLQPARGGSFCRRSDPATAPALAHDHDHTCANAQLLVELRWQWLLGLGRHPLQRDRRCAGTPRWAGLPERGRGDVLPVLASPRHMAIRSWIASTTSWVPTAISSRSLATRT